MEPVHPVPGNRAAGPLAFAAPGGYLGFGGGVSGGAQQLFPAGHGWKKTLLSAAAEEILRQEAAGIAQYHDTWRQDLRRRFNAQNYYLSQEGLSFFYPMFSIAPAAEGVPVFTLPYAAQGPTLPAPQPAPQ